MSHITCFTVRVECWGYGKWTAHTKDKRATCGVFRTNTHNSPTEAMRVLADNIDMHTANSAFVSASVLQPEKSSDPQPATSIHDYVVDDLDLKKGMIRLSIRHADDLTESVLLNIPDEVLQQAKLSLISE